MIYGGAKNCCSFEHRQVHRNQDNAFDVWVIPTITIFRYISDDSAILRSRSNITGYDVPEVRLLEVLDDEKVLKGNRERMGNFPAVNTL